MKLSSFIKVLQKIKNKQEGDLEVIMADGISVIEPMFSDQYTKRSVIITDQK